MVSANQGSLFEIWLVLGSLGRILIGGLASAVRTERVRGPEEGPRIIEPPLPTQNLENEREGSFLFIFTR